MQSGNVEESGLYQDCAWRDGVYAGDDSVVAQTVTSDSPSSSTPHNIILMSGTSCTC